MRTSFISQRDQDENLAVVFVIYKVCFQKLFWLVITVFDNVLNPPLWAFWTLKSKKPLPPISENLLLTSAATLATKIRHKTVTSEAVVTTFINRIKQVNPILNAVVEERFSFAIEEAKKVDHIIASDVHTTDKLKHMYPLLGIPITIKEAISVSGMSNNGGMISSRLTNTPELSLDWECYNNVTGTTSNPYDNRRTSGASSGGEAALIASAASVIGIGSDALGSLRLPTHFCGIFAHKPTGGIVSIEGH
ncbi:Amidase [Popillia japonica]|uniref:Amidase n=1 Tax=Popillia japonica TaxID=7064 RepID=A0AAW1JFA7_POPJA